MFGMMPPTMQPFNSNKFKKCKKYELILAIKNYLFYFNLFSFYTFLFKLIFKNLVHPKPGPKTVPNPTETPNNENNQAEITTNQDESHMVTDNNNNEQINA